MAVVVTVITTLVVFRLHLVLLILAVAVEVHYLLLEVMAAQGL
jgi:hypothetical protein